VRRGMGNKETSPSLILPLQRRGRMRKKASSRGGGRKRKVKEGEEKGGGWVI